jgi:hypothetical protein
VTNPVVNIDELELQPFSKGRLYDVPASRLRFRKDQGVP